MKSKIIENTTKDIFSLAGIEVNGPNPWDIQIYNKDFLENPIWMAGGNVKKLMS